jgi:hypothetical protein
MLLVQMPRPSRILARAISGGVCWGSACGALTLLGLALVIACAAGPFALLIPAVFFALLAAAAGSLAGIACGLSAGVALIVLRFKPGVSLPAVRLTAATGAALLPAVCMIALSWRGDPAWFIAAALTALAFGLGAAGGPAAFYDESRKRPRS